MRKGKNNYIIRENIVNGMFLNSKSTKIIVPDGREISIQGDIKSYYRQIYLKTKDKASSFPISRVVCWLAHGEPPADHYEADHIDRDISNNDPSNLRWVTPAGNLQNVTTATKQQRKDYFTRVGNNQAGEKNQMCKYTDEIIKEMYTLRKQGWKQKAIAKKFGTSQCHVSDILAGKKWNHLHHLFSNPDVT